MALTNSGVEARKSLMHRAIGTSASRAITGAATIDDRMCARYALVGFFATCVHYAVLSALVEFAGTTAGPAAAVGATLGALTAYAGNRRFTFTSRASHGVALPRFFLVAAIGAAVSGSIVWAGTVWLQVHYLMAQMIATALILWAGFTFNRHWTFA